MAVRAPTLAWALRRALLGLFILFVSIAAAASLLYASIDPEEEARAPAFSESQLEAPLKAPLAVLLALPAHA